MATLDGYRRAASALRALDPEDQAWLLGQLDEDDRRRVAALLQEVGGAVTSAPPPSAATEAHRDEEDYAATIASASTGLLEAALKSEPDWVIAVLRHEGATALRRYLEQMPPERAARIDRLAAVTAASVKPKVREVVRRCIAERIDRESRARPRMLDFESLVIRARIP